MIGRASNTGFTFEIIDDAFAQAPPLSKWLMYIAIPILFILTSYGAWLFLWNLYIAIVLGFLCTLISFIIQYKAILLKKKNRFGILPYLYMISLFIPLSLITFFSLHALSIHFNLNERLEEEMLCKATLISEMYTELEDYKELEISKVSDVYYTSVNSNSGYDQLLAQPFNLSVSQNQNLQAGNISAETLFNNHVLSRLDKNFNTLKQDLDIDNVVLELEKDYNWKNSVEALKFHQEQVQILYNIQKEFCENINTDSSSTLLNCQPIFSEKSSDSLLKQWDVARQNYDWKYVGVLILFLLSLMMPIMTSIKPIRRES